LEAGRATFVGTETAVLTPADVWKVEITSHMGEIMKRNQRVEVAPFVDEGSSVSIKEV